MLKSLCKVVLCIVWTKRSKTSAASIKTSSRCCSFLWSLTGRNKGTSLRTGGGVSGSEKRVGTWEGSWRQREGIFGDFPQPQYSADWKQLLHIMKVENPFLDFQMINLTLLRNNDEIVWLACEDYMKRRKRFSYFLSFWLPRCLFFNNLWLSSDFVFFPVGMFLNLLNKTLWLKGSINFQVMYTDREYWWVIKFMLHNFIYDFRILNFFSLFWLQISIDIIYLLKKLLFISFLPLLKPKLF